MAYCEKNMDGTRQRHEIKRKSQKI
jgi:hypothetical protein